MSMITIKKDKKIIGIISEDDIKNCPKMYNMIQDKTIILDTAWSSVEIKMILDYLRGYKMDLTRCYNLALELELIESLPDQSKINVSGKYFWIDCTKFSDKFYYFESFFKMHRDKHPDYTIFVINRSPTIFEYVIKFLKMTEKSDSDKMALNILFGKNSEYFKTNVLIDLDYFGFKNNSIFERDRINNYIDFTKINTICLGSKRISDPLTRINNIHFEKKEKFHYKYEINTGLGLAPSEFKIVIFVQIQDCSSIDKIIIDDLPWEKDLQIKQLHQNFVQQDFNVTEKIEIICNNEITIHFYKTTNKTRYGHPILTFNKIKEPEILNLKWDNKITFPIKTNLLSFKLYFENKTTVNSSTALKNNAIICSSNMIRKNATVNKNGKIFYFFEIEFRLGGLYGKIIIIEGDTITLTLDKKYNGLVIIEKKYIQP
jgi:hypothetical protein